MALVLNDRVSETCSSPGTGAVTLLGAVTGFQPFSTGVGNGNTCYYCIADQGGANWEVGIGTYATSGNTLTRTTPLSGSATTPVDFSSGVQNVFVTYPAEKSVNLDASGNVSALGTVSSGTWNGTTIAVANGGTGVTTSTGTGSVVLSNSPALTTPNLGTPSAITLTNGTGLPLTTGVSGVLPTANGGTNLSSFTSGGAVYATSTTALTTGTLPLSSGGTNSTTAQDAINTLAGAVTSGYYLRGNGTNVTMSAISAGDIPSLSGTYLAVAGGAMTGGFKEAKQAISASDIDLSTGNYFSKTISGTTTFTVSNVPTTGTAVSLILDLTNGGSATVNWWSGVDWAGGTAPTLTASGRDSLGFYTYDGGTTWTGLVLGLNLS